MDEDIHERVRTLITEQNSCVLATAWENRPHCSLMAYTSNDECDEIYFMTSRTSRKYQNMLQNHTVSLLIDTRQTLSKFHQTETMALTLTGRFNEIIDNFEREKIREKLSLKHPGFKEFFGNQDTEPVKIIVESILLLEGPTKAHYMAIWKALSPDKRGGYNGKFEKLF